MSNGVRRRLEDEARRLARAEGAAVRAEVQRWDPLWAPQVLILVAILLDLALSGRVTIGPNWLLPALEAVAVAALIASAPHPVLRRHPMRRWFALGTIAVVSAVNIVSLILLSQLLIGGTKTSGRALIGSGVLLWVTNVLLFGVWFWMLDCGGPMARAGGEERPPDFLFVQMTNREYAPAGWRPTILDYLYTSFTNATAFSPTDTMPLTPTAKLLMSTQSLTALVTVGLVVARAVNILQS